VVVAALDAGLERGDVDLHLDRALLRRPRDRSARARRASSGSCRARWRKTFFASNVIEPGGDGSRRMSAVAANTSDSATEPRSHHSAPGRERNVPRRRHSRGCDRRAPRADRAPRPSARGIPARARSARRRRARRYWAPSALRRSRPAPCR
jgi:hypothetical protein